MGNPFMPSFAPFITPYSIPKHHFHNGIPVWSRTLPNSLDYRKVKLVRLLLITLLSDEVIDENRHLFRIADNVIQRIVENGFPSSIEATFIY
jgi:hypothetical protein